MSQLKISMEDFSLNSQWRCSVGSNGTRFIVEGPTTATKTKVFAFSLPAGAIVNYVRVYATLGTPLTGAAIRTANGVAISGSSGYAEMDLDTFEATTGSYSVTFKFKANGAVYADTQYHSGTLSFSNVYLLVDYTILNSDWSVSVASVEAGNSATIVIEPHDVTCSHELIVAFGSISKTYGIGAGVTNYTLDIPYEWLKEIPNSTSGVATLKLKTLLADVELGVSEAINLTIVCPDDIVPVAKSLLIEVVNPVWGLCIQNYSSVRFALRGCEGVYGATIQYGNLRFSPMLGSWIQHIYDDYIEFELTDKITVAGEIAVEASVTDSRGRSASVNTTINVQPYSGPSISQTTQGRANSEGAADSQGTYVYAGAVYSYTEIGANSAVMQIYYREDGAIDWTLGYEGQLASGELTCFGGMFGTAIVYELKYVISDALATTSVIRTIGTAYAFMKWMPQSNAIGFGCIPRGANMFEVGSDWRVYAYGKDIESYVPARNYVDNGFFLKPVNQRAFVFSYEIAPASTMMYLDRWEITGVQTAKISIVANEGIVMTGVSSDDYIEIRQRFEDYSIMAGHDYTVLCCIDGVEHHCSFKMGQCTEGREIAGLTFYSTENAHIAFRNSAATQVSIQWIAMYKGALTDETLPKYVPKGYGVEWLECSRYFVRVGLKILNAVAQHAYVGFYQTSNQVCVSVPCPNVLRANPTASYGSWDMPATMEESLFLYNSDGRQATVTGVSILSNQNGGVYMYISVDETTAGAINTPVTLFLPYALHLSADV